MPSLFLRLLLLLLLGHVARADEPPPAAPLAAPAPKTEAPTPEQAADAVVAALATKDDAALKALAAKDDPDPWLVADELIRRGQQDAAEAFAKAAPRVDTERLPAYVASRRGTADDSARRARLAAASTSLAADRFAEALATLGTEEPAPIADVLGVRLAMGRGFALRFLVRLDASAAAFLTAGEAAEQFGWLARAAPALYESGLSAVRRSAFAAARGAWERLLSVSERRGDQRGAAAALGSIGVVHQLLGEYAKALSTLERALAAQEALGDKAGAAATLGNIGIVHERLGDYAQALSIYERALAAREAVGDMVGAATTLGDIGNVHYALGDYAKALARYEKALAAQEALGYKRGAAKTLSNIGNIYYAVGDHTRALATYERALAAKEALGDQAGAALTLGNIGRVHLALGDYAGSLATLKRALAAQEELGDRVEAGKTLGSIGSVHRALGDYEKALATQEGALAIKEALGDKAGAAQTLANVGTVHYELGNYARALAVYERALAAHEALGDQAGAARTLVNIGGVHAVLGSPTKALATYERALAATKVLGDNAGVAVLLNNIGDVHRALGDYAKALASYEHALATQQALGAKAGVAVVLSNIGSTYFMLGEHAKALSNYERALATQNALGSKAAASVTLGNIGNVHHALRDYSKALAMMEQALEIARDLGATPLVAHDLSGLARVRLGTGDVLGALAAAHEAVLLLKTLVGGLGEEQGAHARGRYVGLFATGLLAAASASDVEDAYFFLESGRAGTLLESLGGRERLRGQVLPAGLLAAEATARVREARALAAHAKSLEGADRQARAATRKDLEAARTRVLEVVESIQRDAKGAAQLVYPEPTPLGDIQARLGPDEALVLYGLPEKERAHALVVTRDAARLIALGSTGTILAACEALDLAKPNGDPAKELGRLRALVVDPLDLSPRASRVLISPEGPLGVVPFAALLSGVEVVCVPSGTTYGVLLEEQGRHGGKVLALGDPDYTARFDPIALDVYAPPVLAQPTRGRGLQPLPATRAEVQAVGDVVLLGKDASEPGLRDALAANKERWRAVHFACHGLVNRDHPMLSSLALTPSGGEDGFLTALEVLRMRIPADLAVLSACETGKGMIAGGEGIVGLTRAFLYAGAPRVLCSLWKVDDAATSALMRRFYELWTPKDGTAGLSAAEALRQAQQFIAAQERWRHPYYWAAWVLWGLP